VQNCHPLWTSPYPGRHTDDRERVVLVANAQDHELSLKAATCGKLLDKSVPPEGTGLRISSYESGGTAI
jgi:hypothetical protein